MLVYHMKQRHKRLLDFADKADCDMMVALEPENLFYMTGFWGEGAGILEKNGQTTIIAPELEAARARDESCDCNVQTAERGVGLLAFLAKQIKKSNVLTDCQNYSTVVMLKKYIPKIKALPEPFYDARMIKDEAEIKVLKKASRIIDHLFELCTNKLKQGQKESELQAILMSHAICEGMFDTGYRSTLNPLIIAGGPNGALPHAQVTNRKFRQGDLVVVDITLRYKGYVSDATRTFAVGPISPSAKVAYETVKESQKLGLSYAKPDVKCNYVDLTCRQFIEKENFGNYFVHSTGHGIGLEVHEPPTLSSKSTTKLEKNMAITIEPGIYIPRKFGIRIEDSLIVNNRPIIMHKFTKDLITV